MNVCETSTFLIAAIALVGGAVRVDAACDPSPRLDSDRAIVLRTSDLRSAYLVRNGKVHYDDNDRSPEGLRSQLQRHFDTVAALLLLITPQSIELALDRLEAHQHKPWSAEEREEWRERLLRNRHTQIARLNEYRNRGRFPQNEGLAAQPVPIFVDRHETACAVGHLMRLSGRERDVADVQRGNNLVYVPDVTAGPVVAWTLTSGITLEEAALVQPAYGPILHPISDAAAEVLSESQSFEFDHLRFSNFKIYQLEDGAEVPAVNIPVTHQFCGWFGCGGTDTIYDTFQLETGITLDYPRVIVQFDVQVTSPDLRIVNRPFGGTLTTEFVFHQGNRLQLFASGDRERLWVDYSPAFFPQFVGPDGPIGKSPVQTLVVADDFEPTDRMTVVTEMLIANGRPHQAQFINFDLIAVPEPATAALAALAMGLIGIARVRRVSG